MKKFASGYRLIFGYLGIFWIMIGAICLSPLIALPFYPSEAGIAHHFYIVGSSSIVAGAILAFTLLYKREKSSLGKHQDYLLLVLVWVSAILIGALPFYLRGDMTFTQSVFEATSGLTSTGLTVYDFALDSNLSGFHIYTLYRSLLIFFGAIGLVLILVSALSDRYGMRLYTSEGHNDKLLPNLAKSSRSILAVYVSIILLGAIAYTISGMSFFDATNHAMAAVGTGSFSTSGNGVLGVGGNAIAIEIISIILMVAGATSFVIHLLLIRGRFKKVFRDIEVRFFLGMLFIFIPLFAVSIYFSRGPELANLTFFDSLRIGAFYMVSSITTTGFSSYQPIVYLGSPVIFMSACLMVIGGAMSSTAGGIKQYRLATVIKGVYYSIFDRMSSKRIIHPRYILRFGESKEFTTAQFNESASYLVLYLVLLFAGTLGITLMPGAITFDAAFYEVASAISNTGLSVGVTSATQNAGVIWILAIVMFLGRLEIAAVYYAGLRMIHDIFGKETI